MPVIMDFRFVSLVFIPLIAILLVVAVGDASRAHDGSSSTPAHHGRDDGKKVRKDLIQELFEKTAALQAKHNVPYVQLKTWLQQRGVYRSDIKLNFHGSTALAEARRLLSIYDNNMFVTAWVTSSLLEAFRYDGAAPRPSEQQLEDALEALHANRDRNRPYNTSTFTFWQQSFNTTLRYWESTPVNLLGAFSLLNEMPLHTIEEILNAVGLSALAKELKSILDSESTMKRAFHIPPDFDDTFVNLGLGSLLYQLKKDFASPWIKWMKNNSNITSAFDALKRYAYRPFSKDDNCNSIDPRTYYVMRRFLDQAAQDGHDLAIVPTWVQNIKELRTEFYKGVAMPFQINNVDVTVAANTVFGMTSSILAGLVSPDVMKDKEIAQIYLNTSALIAHELTNNMTDRPDLALLYYPSEIEFDWFVSRSVDAMETYCLTRPLPHPVLQTVFAMLSAATKGAMTQSLLSKAKNGEFNQVYFDDFLGNGDKTFGNKTLNRAEDRIFTTAMAANALLYTWTIFDDQTGRCHWKEGVPAKVKLTIEGCIRWLKEHTLDGNYNPWNAFFSGSAKQFESLPFFYPANRLEFLNGTVISNWTHLPVDPAYILAVRGHISTLEYERLLQEPHFGEKTPRTFHGYNSESGYFPLWSSDAYTYSVTLVALCRFDSISG